MRNATCQKGVAPVSDSNQNPDDERENDFFDQLASGAPRDQASFTIGFRGYDRGEVDAALSGLRMQAQRAESEAAELRERLRGEVETVQADSEDRQP